MRQFAVLIFALWASLVANAANAGPALVFDAGSGRVLHSEKAMAPWFPASLTKLMTAYVAFGAVRDGRIDLKGKIVASKRARAQPPSKLGLPIGGKISVELALKALIVMSANDVAVMLAEAVSGSVEKFVSEMNATALELGMNGTYFVNPHGLPDPGQVTTARDIGLLSRALIRDFPEYGALFGLQRIKIGKRSVRSHNRLLGKFGGADGMKTGYICASGYNVVASATRGERRVIAIVLGATSGKVRNDKASALLEQGFSDAGGKGIVPKKLEDLSPAQEYGLLPEHMGPAVCRRRYGKSEPYAVDAKLRAREEAKKVSKIAELSKLAAASSVIPLIGTGQATKVPVPTLRPER